MLVRIATYANPVEAHLARGRLETEQIPAFVCHEHHIWANWLMSLALQGVKVYVHLNDAARAKAVIAGHEQGLYALPDEESPWCQRCGGRNVTRRRLSWKAALLTVNLASVPLYFRWATWRCENCGNEWDLPRTNAYPCAAISLAAGIALAAVFLALALLTCWSSPSSPWAVFYSCSSR